MAQFYARLRAMMLVIDFASWRWLAITTGVMVYMSFENSVKLHVPPGYDYYVLAGIVLLFYIMIDHGLGEALGRYVRGRKLTVSEEARQNHKRLLNYIFIFLLVRLLASALSSVWSGGEIGDLTTEDFDPTLFTSAVAERDSTEAARISSTEAEMAQLRNSEEQRLEQVAIDCAAETRKQYNSGTKSQREMWDCCRNFYENLQPSSKYYKTNKAFYERMLAAEAKCLEMEQAERAKTTNAETLYYAVSSDNSGGSYVDTLSMIAGGTARGLQVKEQRRTRMVIISDFLALILGVFSRIKIIHIDIVTDRKPDPRSISDVMARAMEKVRQRVLSFLEELFGVDLDGNGEVGSVDNRLTKGSYRPIAESMTSGHRSTAHEPPSLSPKQPMGFFSKQAPENEAHSIVATSSYNDLSEEDRQREAKLLLSHYRDHMSKQSAVMKNPGYTESTRIASVARHQDEIDFAVNRLKKLGYKPDLIKNVYQLVPLG